MPGRARYEIVVRGCLSPRLARLLDGFEPRTPSPGRTHFVGWVQDQSALHGALRRLADFGFELVSVTAYPPD